MHYDEAFLQETYEGMTAVATARCRLTGLLIGGQPASEKGVRMFCEFHLKLQGQDLEDAIKRILKEEVGEKPEASNATGELEKTLTYGVNVLRHDANAKNGCYIGQWQIKANMKQAASRVGLFQAKKGSKGDLSEACDVRAWGISALTSPRHVFLLQDGEVYKGGKFFDVRGAVSGPSGTRSIRTDAEYAPEGCEFEFRARFPANKVNEEDMLRTFAMGRVCGLGSTRGKDFGKYEVLDLVLDGFDTKKTVSGGEKTGKKGRSRKVTEEELADTAKEIEETSEAA